MKRKISRGYRKLNNGHLVTFTGHVSASMTGNVNFPTPVPSLAVFDAALEAYSTACTNYQRGNILTTTVRDETRRVLLENMDLLANYVELTVEFKETLLVTSGFDLVKEPSKRPIPSIPVILEIADGVKSGQIKLRVDSDAHVRNFTTLYKVTGSEVQPQYKFADTRRTITIDGLTAGQYYSFQVSAANAAGESGWSAEQSFLVR
ncbi:MAG TPA: fibronectin type III domain-containing protein [Cytophagales bacterium]|nr:fibronectin type III domain-containing protein [Cytophagales bacterium]